MKFNKLFSDLDKLYHAWALKTGEAGEYWSFSEEEQGKQGKQGGDI